MVGDIGCVFTLEAWGILFVGLFLLFLGLLAIIGSLTSTGPRQIGYEGPLIIVAGLLVSALALFVFKVISAFERFEPWSYRWVQLLSRSSQDFGNWLVFKNLYNEDLRRAFNQPEYEYSEHPEYGPKLDDQGRPKRPRDKD